MAEPLELKKTLNLLKTGFPMKAGLPQNEPKQLAAWQESRLYDRILAARKDRPLFVLHDGPPYPTGTIHVGTGLNKTVKDLIVKSRSMAGFYAPYVPGWDCHGLPIETQVEKELGGKGKVPPDEFRRKCREFATRYVDQQRRDFKRLGIFGRWDDPYLTMSFSYEATIANTFLDFMQKGYVYRGYKPVYWCIYDTTALAEAEVEYEDHASPSIWVTFAIVSGGKGRAAKLGPETKAVIWTTTPWTLPHNRALAFHPGIDYAVVDTERGALLIAADRVSALHRECGLKEARVRATVKGSDFEGMKFQHPFLPIEVPGVLADYVTLEQGSGIVHTAPGHGVEDFLTGQKYGLETHVPLDDRGVFTEGLPEYKGKDVFTANPIIVELLRKRGALLCAANYTHSYPHCWRCHNPVIFRATEQWFIKMDQAARPAGARDNVAPKTLRQEALEEVRNVKWFPAWGEGRLSEMIAGRPDWCVSRQRFWGVPIIVFFCDACGKQLQDFAALRHVVKWFEKEGADAWYRHSPEELLPAGTKCSCGAVKWRKEHDILDVWFDSGSSSIAVLTAKEGLTENGEPWRSADVYMEGPDQYRGWFQSSLLVAVGVKDRAPFKQVVTHGWTLDDKGDPMSKSRGNALEPKQIFEKWGADLFRLWVGSVEYQSDVTMSDRGMTQLSEAYRKIRNTFRFALINVADFDPNRDALLAHDMEELDRWMLERTAELVKKCREWYQVYDFHRVYHAIHDFCVVDLSAFYFDVLKDRLYTKAPRSKTRRSAQTAIYKIASALVRLLAPILVFTAEEIWKYLPKAPGDPDSVHIAEFPVAADLDARTEQQFNSDFEMLLQWRGRVLKELEDARNSKFINSSLEAKVVLEVSLDAEKLLKRHEHLLPSLFIVSQVDVKRGIGPQSSIHIERADGTKCERCWNYSVHVGENPRYPTVCERCTEALAEIEGEFAAHK